MEEIRVMLVDDHPIYRKGVVLTLMDYDSSVNVVSEAENVKEAIETLSTNSQGINLVLLDLQLPDGSGIEVARFIKEHYPDMKILVLSVEIRQGVLMPLVELDIDGFLHKDAEPEELSTAIHSVMEGSRYYGKSISSIIDNVLAAIQTPHPSLSKREKEILKMVASGISVAGIAQELNISPRTVESHKENLFNKLNVRSTVELINYAFQIGII